MLTLSEPPCLAKHPPITKKLGSPEGLRWSHHQSAPPLP